EMPAIPRFTNQSRQRGRPSRHPQKPGELRLHHEHMSLWTFRPVGEIGDETFPGGQPTNDALRTEVGIGLLEHSTDDGPGSPLPGTSTPTNQDDVEPRRMHRAVRKS